MDEVAERMAAFRAQHLAEMEHYQSLDFVKGFDILTSPDSCEACRRLKGKVYSLAEDVPLLPYEHCTHEIGCRCIAQPILAKSEFATEGPMEETITIQKTSKQLKKHKAISLALILGGLLLGLTGQMSVATTMIGLAMLVVGTIWYFANRIQTWWHHG